MTTARIELGFLSVALLMATAGCAAGATDGPPEAPLEAARISAFSTYAASLGSLVEIYGTGFPVGGDQSMKIVLDGTYDTGGGVEPVHLEIPVRILDQGTALWSGFGPYHVPFGSSGSGLGRFEGTAGTVILNDRGEVLATDDEPLPFTFDVQPSIRVREFQPTTASCAGPIRRALGGAPYRLTVEALGFVPESFTYTLSTPQLDDVVPISVRHVTSSAVDTVGNSGELTLPEVPPGRITYGLAVSVYATDAAGRSHQSLFSLTVHRPIEVYYNGNVTVAETLAPVPVSGCIPGGEVGRTINYTETTTETRDRRMDFNWNSNWMDSHMVSEGSSDTIGQNERNGVGFATTDGTNFNWNVGTEHGVSGGASVPLLAEASYSGKISAGYGQGGMHSDTENRDRSWGSDTSTTTTESVSDTTSTGGGEGGSLAMSISSSESISVWFTGNVIARTQGVFYRQTTRLIRRAAVLTYNLCGAAEVIGDVDLEDWTWSPDLALGQACPPLPQSNLPEAQCYLAPCTGE